MKGGRRSSGWRSWRSPEQRLLRRVVVLTVAAFIGGYLVAFVWMRAGAPRRTVVTVPDLRELTLADATQAIERADLSLEVSDSLPNPEIAAGQVLTQSPLPGQEVAPRTAIRVIMSTGRERHEVPQVNALSREQAERLLLATGLHAVVEAVNDLRPPGRVVGTIPPAGSVVAVPARIRLVISSGPPRVAVPMLVGLQEVELLGVLGAAGLRLGEVTRELRIAEAEGQVVAQRPEAEDSIPAGSLVDVVVATQRPELLPPPEIR